MPVTRAMLMAAGLGTRLRPFTDLVPKALMPVMGVPIAQLALDSIVRAGVDRVVVNIHHHAAQARRGIEALDRAGAQLTISDESSLLLGSSGALRKAEPHFEGQPFFLVNADVLCDVDLKALARTHEHLRSRWNVAMTLAVFPEPPTSGKYREIFLNQQTGLVSGFSPDLRSGRPFFIGSAVLEPEALRDVPPSGPSEFVPTILEPMVRERRVGFHLTTGNWKDIGAPSLWLDAHMFLIEALETGRLAPVWRSRFEDANRRMQNGIWVSERAYKTGGIELRNRVSRWSGPCYFSGAVPPMDFGPKAVLYGSENPGTSAASDSLTNAMTQSSHKNFEYGIGMGDQWTAS